MPGGTSFAGDRKVVPLYLIWQRCATCISAMLFDAMPANEEDTFKETHHVPKKCGNQASVHSLPIPTDTSRRNGVQAIPQSVTQATDSAGELHTNLHKQPHAEPQGT